MLLLVGRIGVKVLDFVLQSLANPVHKFVTIDKEKDTANNFREQENSNNDGELER